MQTPPRALAQRTSTRTYPGAPDRISAVRADLRSSLAGCPLLAGCPIADDLILCASELATNAAVHSRSGLPGGTFTVRATIDPGRTAMIEVEDNGGPWTPAVSDPDRYHGLDIIRTLANDWGITGDHTSRVIWAQFNWPDT